MQLYNQYKTDERTVVAYKGDQVEKDLLNKLNIPCLDLETCMGLLQVSTVKAYECRSVIELWFSPK